MTELYYNKIPCHYHKIRIEKVLFIRECFSQFEKFLNLTIDNQFKLCLAIERSINNATCETANKHNTICRWDDTNFVIYYRNTACRVTKNLDINSEVSSNYLGNAILDGVIDPRKVGYMSSEELCPERSNEIKNICDIRNNQKIEGKVSKQYKCSICGCRETYVNEKQSRRADEGTTTFIECVTCKYRWRIN